MGIRSMIVYFWYVPKGYRKQHFHSLIAILKIGILIELFHNPWNPYSSRTANVIRTVNERNLFDRSYCTTLSVAKTAIALQSAPPPDGRFTKQTVLENVIR